MTGEASSGTLGPPPSPPTGEGAASQGSTGQASARSLCAFWLGEKAYAVETAIVGEVLTVEDFVPVPGTPAAVLGLFDLRGTPVSLVDLEQVLGQPGERRAGGRARTVLVLRRGETLVTGVQIDRMELVLQAGQGTFNPRDPSDENPVVQGFLELDLRGGLVLTVLDSAVLFQRLDHLKFR
jgi:purine-binding chemotaxis protein CheW